MSNPESLPASAKARWLLLIHQLPPQPAYLRVKIWRRLQAMGAVAVKGAVYALPLDEQTQEDFRWLVREIIGSGGEAALCEARFVDGLSDRQVRALFDAARDADYEAIRKEAAALADELAAQPERQAETGKQLARLRRQLTQIAAIDFFGANRREAAEAALAALETRLAEPEPDASAEEGMISGLELRDLHGRTWVTREGVHVDRIASAWLVRTFIDPEARFEFVAGKGRAPRPGEIRFDMYEAEFTHEGDRCTFEVLLERAALDEPALRAIGEIVHDVDLKDDKFGREETAGIAGLIAGIVLAHPEDEQRLARGAAVLDDLYQYFRNKKP
ncbi:MAG: chromate resistance protein ChrB domain-containing protein [Geminicoccaceae bacterium]